MQEQVHLTFISPWANSADDKLVIFFLFFPKIGFDIACKLFLLETIYIKCILLFSGKNKKKYFNMSSAENFTRMLSINPCPAEPGYTLPLQKV